MSQIVVYTTAAGVVGLQATFGGLTSALAGTKTAATSQTVTLQVAEFISQVTSWASGNKVTGVKFVTSAGKTYGPYGLSAGNGVVAGTGSQALVAILGWTLPTGGLYSPLQFTWAAPLGDFTGTSFTVASPRENCAAGAPYQHVQTIMFFLYNGKGSKVPNYICGLQIAINGVPSKIMGTFAWPDTTGFITTQTLVIPSGDILNRFDIVECNIAAGAQAQMCGATFTSLKGTSWTYGTTQQQATAAGAFTQAVALNFAQNAAGCVFRGFKGDLYTVKNGAYSLSNVVSVLVE